MMDKHRKKELVVKIIKIILAVLLPPVAAFLQVGIGIHFWLNIVLCFLGGIPGVFHALWLVLTEQVRTRKNSWFVWVVLAIPFTLFLTEWLFSPGGFKRLYYFHVTYDKDKVQVVEDAEFPFFQEAHSQEYQLNSSYYGPHRILLIPESKLVPVDYEFTSSFFIEIFDSNDNLLMSFTTDDPRSIFRKNKDDYYGNHLIYCGKQRRVASSVFAFELGEIPFDLIRLKWNRLKNMKIKITVIEPEKGLLEFCDKATLVIIPDLRY